MTSPTKAGRRRARRGASGLLAVALVVPLTGPAPGTAAAAAATTAATTTSFSTVHLEVPSGNGAAPFDQARTLRAPSGWTAEVWARVPGARFALWTPQHTLLVSAPGSGRIVELHPRAARASVPTQTTLVSGLTEPQGMAFDRLDGKTVLYVAESDQLDRYAWDSNGTVGTRTVVVAGLPDTTPGGDDVHRLKEVAVGPDHTIYVDVGSGSNASPRNGNSVAPRASVMAYQPDGKGRVYASGVRNGDGLAFDPDGELWVAVNERDQIAYPFHRSYGGLADAYDHVITTYVNNHPPDELAKLTPGRDLGWPYCNPDPDASHGAPGSALRYADLPFDRDVQTNPTGSALNCATLAPVQRGIPAHSAPLGLTFLEESALPARWAAGAVVAVHGSWDRTPPRAPAVLWFPWEASKKTLGAQVNLITGFQDADGSRWGRVADAVPGPDGALYVTDDTAGAVYRLVPSK